MDIWYTSDLHFGHEMLIQKRHRPFGSTEEMDEYLIEQWNRHVSPNDVIWILGDLVMRPIEESLQSVARLNGRKILVPGNHDMCWRGTSHRYEVIRKWQMRYLWIGELEEIIERPPHHNIAGRRVDLSHFPFSADHTNPPRYMGYRPDDNGDWLLHGHIHELWRQHLRQINVGVDAWSLRPVHIDEIAALIRSGPAPDPLPVL